MSSTITVRGLDPQEESWLEDEARRVGVSMEELVCRLIREKRMKDLRRMKPSQAFAHYFGSEYGVELPKSETYGHRPVVFIDESEV